MTDRFFKRQYSRISAMRAIVVAVVLVLLFCIIFYPNTAYAVCPEGYVSSVEDEELDWYMDALDIEYVTSFVQNMLDDKEKYDFFALEKDPIVIAVIDTGINFQHEIFEGKYDESGAPIDSEGIGEYDVFLRDGEGNIIYKNVYDPSKSAYDDSHDYHGTHVAGIVATFIHKLNLEKYIKILPIKSAHCKGNSSTFPASVLKEAVDFALENGADIINMSLADTGISPSATSSYDFVTKEMADRAIFLSASGNEGKSSSSKVSYPAGNKYVVGVMNCTMDSGSYALSSKSNYGSRYDICFPGISIYSADGATKDGYKALSGTSMATPIASFACALKTLQNRVMCAKYSVQPKAPSEIAELVINSYSSTIKKGGFELKVFDFKELLSQADNLQILQDKEKVYISQSKKDDVTFTAFSEGQIDLSNVTWTIKNESGEVVETGEGETFVFEPKAFGCSYYITATCESENELLTASATIVVVYTEDSCIKTEDIELDVAGESNVSDNISVREDGSVRISSGQSLRFSIADSYRNMINEDTDILWYVNGEYVSSGDTFECEFETSDEYIVCAKINGIFTSETKVIVEAGEDSKENNKSNVLIICFGVLGGSIAIAVVFALILVILKRKI